MKHYDYIEWLLYKNNELPDDKHKEMEEHLYSCNICTDIFLSLIDEKEINAAGNLVPHDFTSNIINEISKQKVKKIVPKENKSFKLQFGIYVAIASVTIFLTLGGFYTNLVDSVPKIASSIELTKEAKPNIIANFSENIVNSTSTFLLNIENMERNKEVK